MDIVAAADQQHVQQLVRAAADANVRKLFGRRLPRQLHYDYFVCRGAVGQLGGRRALFDALWHTAFHADVCGLPRRLCGARRQV